MTYTSFVAGLAALNVSGVTRKYTAPPSQLSSADLPTMYPRLPEGNQEIVSFGYEVGKLSTVCELVVVMKADKQGNSQPNFADCLTMLDALNSALDANAASLNLDRWSLRQDGEQIGETPYWIIVARVEASE